MGSEQAPAWVSILKVVVLDAVVVYATMAFAGGRTGTSFPVSGIILGVLVLFYSFVTRNTIFGRHIYAVGGNRLAAELSGVKSKRVNFLVIMNMSILAALAGMIFVARSVASGPQDGLGWELDAIAAVFIGGAAVSGGIGTVTGSIVGGLVMAVLNNGLQLLGVGSDRVQIIKGMVLLLAVGVDVWNKSQGARPSPASSCAAARPRPRPPRQPLTRSRRAVPRTPPVRWSPHRNSAARALRLQPSTSPPSHSTTITLN
jgi:putative multiple sugar transport system permease protein